MTTKNKTKSYNFNMENMDFLSPTAPILVFARETYTPYIDEMVTLTSALNNFDEMVTITDEQTNTNGTRNGCLLQILHRTAILSINILLLPWSIPGLFNITHYPSHSKTVYQVI